MFKRITLAAMGFVAAGALAFALAAAGFGPGTPAAADAPSAAADPGSAITPVERPVETVYIRPAATPEIVRVTRAADRVSRSTAERGEREHGEREHEGREHEGREHDDD